MTGVQISPDSRVLSALGRKYTASISVTDARVRLFERGGPSHTVQARLHFQVDSQSLSTRSMP